MTQIVYLDALKAGLEKQGRAFDVSIDPRDNTGQVTWTWTDEDGIIHQTRAKFNGATQITSIKDIR